jgi:hypothetical protein
MSKSTRLLAVACGTLSATALIAIGAGAVGAKSAGRKDSGLVYFAITHSTGGKNFAAGNATDKLFGTEAITFVNKITNASGTIKITTKPVTTFYKDGTLSGVATSDLTTGQNGALTITNGKIKETTGTGARKGHSFIGTFSGTGNSNTGLYKITYKGIYR